MYYLDEIMDRTFECWGNLIKADDYSLWGASAVIEAKPNDWTISATATSASSNWSEETDSDSNTTDWNSDSDSDAGSGDWNTDTESEKAASASTIHEITDAISETIDDINPFTSDTDEEDTY